MVKAARSNTGETPAPQVLCPYLIEAKLGTFIIRGRARYPEGVIPPTTIDGGDYCGAYPGDRVPVPSCSITWDSESFEARFVGMEHKHSFYADSALIDALYNRAKRPPGSDNSGEVRYRIDSVRWEAPAELGDRLYIGGTDGYLLCQGGVPVAVVFERACIEDTANLAPVFKAIFAGHATLGEWHLTPSPRKGHEHPDWEGFDGRAEVTWHPPEAWSPSAIALRARGE